MDLPLSCLREGHVHYLTRTAILTAKEVEVKLGSFGKSRSKAEAKMFDQQRCALGVLSFDSLSLIAGLSDGLVVKSHIDVLDIVRAEPIVFLEEGDVDRPLESGCRGSNFASTKLGKRTRSELLAFLSLNSGGEDDPKY